MTYPIVTDLNGYGFAETLLFLRNSFYPGFISVNLGIPETYQTSGKEI